jgi:hypothetical protein
MGGQVLMSEGKTCSLRGSGTISVKDQFIFLASPIFQAQSHGIGDCTEARITRIVPEPLRTSFTSSTKLSTLFFLDSVLFFSIGKP